MAERSWPDDDAPAGPVGRSLADRVRWLIQHMWPAELPPPTSDESVAASIRQVTGQEFSRSTLYNLCEGRQCNPRLRTLRTLADFFQIPLGYFGAGKDADVIAEQLKMLRTLRDNGLDPVALRTLSELPPEGIQEICKVIIDVAALERARARPPADGESASDPVNDTTLGSSGERREV